MTSDNQSAPAWHGTTILSVRKGNHVVIAGDGQVTMGQTVMKANAKKVRRLGDGGNVIAGFAGATADAFTLFERLEGKLEKHQGQLTRACVELAKDWRTDRYLRRLEAMMVVADRDVSLVLTGTGDVLEPERGIIGIGSGGVYALAAARALIDIDGLDAEAIARRAMQIASEICVYTNTNVTLESIPRKRFWRGMSNFSPREIVAELDRYIVGQNDAKRAVAVALRNRWRRQQLTDAMRDEVVPKNILMIGPTGVGKTEIARRLARLAQAPFIKIEATKFTEVGYVGRDVDSIIRDLMETSLSLVRERMRKDVTAKAELAAEERILDAMVGKGAADATRANFRKRVRDGEMDDREIEIEVQDNQPQIPTMDIPGMPGGSVGMINLGDMLGKAFSGNRTKTRRMNVKDAQSALTQEEAEKLLDQERVTREAIDSVEQNGIVFLDEIDKIAGRSEFRGGADVSREGVQRDLLPLIEGTTVNTKYGPVKTDHILFIASGAFHLAKPSDLLPELQGRLPIRVELKPLDQADLRRILLEPEASLIKQYTALMATENVTLDFTDEAIDEVARLSAEINASVENIGARRLHTVLERLLEDISFEASDHSGTAVTVDADLVRDRVGTLAKNADLSKFIL